MKNNNDFDPLKLSKKVIELSNGWPLKKVAKYWH
jgi:hypothetical protein